MNLDLTRGNLFRYRAKELLAYLKNQPAPYTGTDEDLAKAIFIGKRSISRYLRFLRSLGLIETKTSTFELNGEWINRRKIVPINRES